VLSQLFYGTYGMDELTSEEGFRSKVSKVIRRSTPQENGSTDKMEGV
jgi:hypothetical protein